MKNTLYLSEGAKVYCTANLNTDIGLYNSSPGIVRKIIYDEDADPLIDQPKYVLVEFTNYKGEEISQRKVFPIYPIKIPNSKGGGSRL